MQTTTNSPSALGAFVSLKAEIDAILDRLKNFSDDHFGFGPEEVYWGHVGQLTDKASLLRRITDSALNEGEHSRQDA